jgi:bifunctional pyridoxal-dependent enzyme with beta-cystathionase and maltose regulon repressor activities
LYEKNRAAEWLLKAKKQIKHIYSYRHANAHWQVFHLKVRSPNAIYQYWMNFITLNYIAHTQLTKIATAAAETRTTTTT